MRAWNRIPARPVLCIFNTGSQCGLWLIYCLAGAMSLEFPNVLTLEFLNTKLNGPAWQNFYLLFIDWNRPHNIACFCDRCTIKSRGTSKAGQTAPVLRCSITETVQNQGMASLGWDSLQRLTGAAGCFSRGQLPYDLTVALPSCIHH